MDKKYIEITRSLVDAHRNMGGFSMIKTGITPEINALSAVLVVVSMVLIGIALILQGNPIRPRSERPSQV